VEALEEELRPLLDRGEKLLWAGRPVQGVVFTALDWYLIPFSVVWLGLVLLTFRQALKSDPLGGLTSVLFVGVGFYMLVGRYVADWYYRSRALYGVTDRRAIIVSRIAVRSVQSIDFSSLTGLRLEERGDGTGTIFFGDQPPYWSRQRMHASWGVGTQFFRVADGKKVYSIVRDVMQRQKSKG
jgi:hypothetical protein